MACKSWFFFSKDKYFIKPTCLIESTIDTSHWWIFKTQSIGNVGLKRPSRNSKTLKTQSPSTHLCCLFTSHARCIISTIKEMEIVPFLRYAINCLFFFAILDGEKTKLACKWGFLRTQYLDKDGLFVAPTVAYIY